MAARNITCDEINNFVSTMQPQKTVKNAMGSHQICEMAKMDLKTSVPIQIAEALHEYGHRPYVKIKSLCS